ncbi:MAG: hypothetical protein KDK30_11765, partial [Leptospiraceae bacterium]|nr:hypothetical protein [Leptospiraceae bacterium]
MGAFYEQIPTALQKHIKGITRSSGLPQSDDSVELMSEAWLNKKEAFERELEARNMEEVASLDKYDERGAVVMTYSGSLINIGPLMGDTRQVEYSSIGLRADVPDSADHNAALLMEDVEVDREVSFEEGPVS